VLIGAEDSSLEASAHINDSAEMRDSACSSGHCIWFSGLEQLRASVVLEAECLFS
jgi:hypothetical protein